MDQLAIEANVLNSIPLAVAILIVGVYLARGYFRLSERQLDAQIIRDEQEASVQKTQSDTLGNMMQAFVTNANSVNRMAETTEKLETTVRNVMQEQTETWKEASASYRAMTAVIQDNHAKTLDSITTESKSTRDALQSAKNAIVTDITDVRKQVVFSREEQKKMTDEQKDELLKALQRLGS